MDTGLTQIINPKGVIEKTSVLFNEDIISYPLVVKIKKDICYGYYGDSSYLVLAILFAIYILSAIFRNQNKGEKSR